MRAQQRGFTLIEVTVGIAIGVFLTAAAVSFVRFETRLMGLSNERLDMVQTGRSGLDIIAKDLRLAGMGMSLDAANDFVGLLHGTFTLDGVQFNPNGFSADINLERGQPAPITYATQTQDLGIRAASGTQSSIVDFTTSGGSGTMRVCDHAELDLDGGEIVLIRDQEYLANRAIEVSVPSAVGACRCQDGCVDVSWGEPAEASHRFENYPGAQNVDYNLGSLFADFETIVYFVADQGSGPGRGQLRRAQFDEANIGTCNTARDATCGVAVSEDVEALYFAIWGFDPTTGQWAQVAPGASIPGDQRLRVDVELIARIRPEGNRVNPPVVSVLTGNSLPPAGRDRIEREVFRTSVDIKNSGRL